MKTTLLSLSLATAAVAQPAADLPWWPESQRDEQAAYEVALNEVPSPQRLRAWHDLFGSEPHVAGTPGDLRNIERLAAAFEQMGLTVERHEFLAWLPRPVEASLEIVSPVMQSLPLVERVLPEDPFSGHPDLAPGWNAYSGNGDVTGEIVYANYGTKQDFQALQAWGVDVAGRIVIARYGGNFRGFKAKFAEAAGAAGLIIYTDPDDSGWRKGIPYPEGGYANEASIQRGSIKALDYPGDPLTPFVAAGPDAERLDPGDVALPRIPVQPVGWGAAAEIMSRMDGPGVPTGWQGGLPFAYRLTGGAALRVRLHVEQQRGLLRSANVIATLTGSTEPQRRVVIGCHHDAWGFGAGDPLAGIIVLYECARSFAELARRGVRPQRSIVFAAWGAEEHGIIGSVEWCEANAEQLRADAVAYINLDMAAMGPTFRASSAPALKTLIASAARSVASAGIEQMPSFGTLGGGSDHVGFYCHLGVTSCGLGGQGSPGTSYHSNYDTLAWYRKVVGDDYEPALMVTRIANLIAARLAGGPLLPLDLSQYAPDLREHLAGLGERAAALAVELDLGPLEQAVDELEAVAGPVQPRLLEAVAGGRLSDSALRRVNEQLLAAERAWLHEPGLPQRPWFRNLYAATDPDSGYAAWLLPALRYHVERTDAAGAADVRDLYVEAVQSVGEAMKAIDAILDECGGF